MLPKTSGGANPLADKEIVVAGGGIAGLAFARAIERHWPHNVRRPRIRLYERRQKKVSPDREGYSVSIRSDAMSGGMQALQKLGILDEVLAASITGQQGGAGAFCVWDADWNPILRFKAPKSPPDNLPAHAMRIARYILRQHLIDALPESVDAHWDLGCSSAAVMDDGRMKVTLTDGSIVDCDFLVAADGANSMLREALRPNDQLSYAGVVSISATGRFPDGLPDPIKEDHGLVIGGDGTSLFASPVDRYSAVWNVSMLEETPRTLLRGKDMLDRREEVVLEARAKGDKFMPPFDQLVDATDPATLMVFNAMDKQPIDHSGMADMPVVFIGDSNHAVSPFAGNGANMALMDGIDLAIELSNAENIRAAVIAFDEKSMARSKRTVDSSHLTIKIAHSTGWRLALWKVVLRMISFFMSFR